MAGRHSLHADIDLEEAAGGGRVLPRGLVEIDSRGGDVEAVELGSAEGAARDLRDRHLDDAVDLAVRREAGEPPAVPVRNPEAAFGVAGHAVGIAVAFGNGGEDALAGELAVVRQVEDVDRALEGVAVVEPRSEEHTSELQSLMRSSYAVFCLKKKK